MTCILEGQSMAHYSKIIFLIFSMALPCKSSTQSFEWMAGHQRIFLDAQYLKFFDQDRQWSLFSRSRASADYSGDQRNIFLGVYLNRSFQNGLGASMVGRISSIGTGIDLGPHWFKANKEWMIFALPSVKIADELQYQWFSISRWTPFINDNWNYYFGLELFSAFHQDQHVVSVQRLRMGAQYINYQFGMGLNNSQLGKNWGAFDHNLGIFFKTNF